MPLQSPRDLFVYDLSAVHSAEQSTLQIYPQMEHQCRDPQVKQLFSDVTTNLQRQITRIQECFRLMGQQPMSVPCYTADGFNRDWQQFVQQGPSQDIIEVFSLELASQIGHYKLAAYKHLVEDARAMGQSQCASSLEDSLHEKESTVQRTDQLASRIGSQIMQRISP